MKALANLKVLDLTKMLPGNYCSMLLADYGAEVIKVELPGTGDPVRAFQPQRNGLSYWHLVLNRNKKSITLDYKTESGREILKKLAAESDVFLESYRPGVLDELGLSYEKLKLLNPRLIYCSLTGYGQKSTQAAHDLNISGLTGANFVEKQEPFLGNIQLAGLSGAMQAAFAVLAAVNARNMTGEGQQIDISLMRSLLSLQAVELSNHLGWLETGREVYPRRTPNYAVYKTKDGKYMTVGCLEKKFWQKLCEILAITDKQDLLWEKENHPQLFQVLAEIFLQKTQDQWEAIFKKENICVTACHDFSESFAKGIWQENQMLEQVNGQDKTGFLQLAPAIIFSKTPGALEKKAPYLGENNQEVYLSLGVSLEEIRELEKEKII